jgi:hypothetical protein
MSTSETLKNLCLTPENERTPQWETQFLTELSKTNLKLLSEDPQYGPDNWPYLMAATDDTASEDSQKIFQWLCGKGVGLVINPQKEYPDYVLTYGMIWSFRETGHFFKHQNVQNGEVVLEPGQNLVFGEPTEEYLPKYVRTILKEFLRDQSVFLPKVLLISSDKLNYDLAFSLESLGNPPEGEHEGIAEALSWFLPPHYSIVLMSEVGLPSFFEL